MTVGDAWVVVLLVLLIVGAHAVTAREVLAELSKSWPTVEGVIVRLRHRRSRIWPAGREVEYPLVVYEYVLEGRTYSSSRFSFGVSRGTLARLTKDLKEGGKVLVYYRPDRPSVSVLAPGGSAVRKLFLEAGYPSIVLALAGLLLLMAYWYFGRG